MNLARLDMNLVVALRALLAERNVTRAGERIGLSQPAMSAALARLRRHFGDELLARKGGGYELTALGVVLLDRTEVACEMLEQVFGSQPRFDPAREEREFVILTSDYAAAVFGDQLAREVSAQAPGVRITFRQIPVTVTDDPAALLATVDGMILPHGIIGGLPALELFTDSWLCLVAEDNPDVGESITLGDLATLPWAVYQRAYDAPAARQLSTLGIEPRVQVSVDSFYGCRRWSRAPVGWPWSMRCSPPASASAEALVPAAASGCSTARLTRSPSGRRCGGIRSTLMTPDICGCARPPARSPPRSPVLVHPFLSLNENCLAGLLSQDA